MADKTRTGCPAGTGQPDQGDIEERNVSTVYHDENSIRKQSQDKDREIVRLTLENNKLRRNQHRTCAGCENLKQGNVFCECKYLGIVNPWEDYCSKRIGARAAIQKPAYG